MQSVLHVGCHMCAAWRWPFEIEECESHACGRLQPRCYSSLDEADKCLEYTRKSVEAALQRAVHLEFRQVNISRRSKECVQAVRLIGSCLLPRSRRPMGCNPPGSTFGTWARRTRDWAWDLSLCCLPQSVGSCLGILIACILLVETETDVMCLKLSRFRQRQLRHSLYL